MNIPVVTLWIYDIRKEYKYKKMVDKKLSYLLNDVIYLDLSKSEAEMLNFLTRQSEYDKTGKYVRAIIDEEISLSNVK